MENTDDKHDKWRKVDMADLQRLDYEIDQLEAAVKIHPISKDIRARELSDVWHVTASQNTEMRESIALLKRQRRSIRKRLGLSDE